MVMKVLAFCLVLTTSASAQTSSGTAAARALEGRYWRATELGGKRVSNQDSSREAHLQFEAGGRVSGSDGCNRIAGAYQLKGDSITFGEMLGTQMACLDTEGTEGLFHDALKNAARLAIAGDQLELFDGTGKRVALFAARTQASAGSTSTGLEGGLSLASADPLGEVGSGSES